MNLSIQLDFRGARAFLSFRGFLMFLRQIAGGRMLVIAGALFALISQPLNAKPLPGELAEKARAVRLEPTSPWQLEFADDRCRLARKFDSTEGPGMVLFEQIAPGQRFDLTVAGPDFARSRQGSWFYGGMRSDLEMEMIDPLEYGIAGYDNAITLAGIWIDDTLSSQEEHPQPAIAAIDTASADLVDRLVLQRSTTIVSFETGNMQAPFEALNACAQDLVLALGLPASAQQAHVPPGCPIKEYISPVFITSSRPRPGTRGTSRFFVCGQWWRATERLLTAIMNICSRLAAWHRTFARIFKKCGSIPQQALMVNPWRRFIRFRSSCHNPTRGPPMRMADAGETTDACLFPLCAARNAAGITISTHR